VAAVVQGYQGAPPRVPAATDMVRDRVCDTFVPRSRALMAVVDGREQYFCSPSAGNARAAARDDVSRDETQLRCDIVEVGRRLYARGLIGGHEGNVSVRLDTSILITPPASARAS
jgi:hypothetical protein